MSKALEFGKAAIRLGLLSDDIEKQLSGFEARFEKFGKKLISIGKSWSIVGGAITAPFVAGLKVFTDYGEALDKTSIRTGISVASLQQLGFAAEQSGATFEDVGSAAQSMGTLLLLASRGSKKATATLYELGVSLDDLKGKSPDQKFLILANAVSKVQDPLRRAALASKAFGDAGVALLPMMADGAAGIQKLAQESLEVGPPLSQADTQAAAKFNDALDKLWGSVKNVSMQLGAAIVGPMLAFTTAVQPIVAWVAAWIRQHQLLVAMVAATGAVITAIGSTLVTAGVLFLFVAKAISVAKNVLWGLQMAVKGVSIALTFLAANPIALAITAILAVVVGILYWTGALQKLWSWLSSTIGKLLGFSDAADGVNDSLNGIKAPTDQIDEIKKSIADMKLGDLGLDKSGVGASANVGLDNAKQAQALFDVSLARQTIGDGGVQEQQLVVLKSIDRKIDGSGGIPVR